MILSTPCGTPSTSSPATSAAWQHLWHGRCFGYTAAKLEPRASRPGSVCGFQLGSGLEDQRVLLGRYTARAVMR